MKNVSGPADIKAPAKRELTENQRKLLKFYDGVCDESSPLYGFFYNIYEFEEFDRCAGDLWNNKPAKTRRDQCKDALESCGYEPIVINGCWVFNP